MKYWALVLALLLACSSPPPPVIEEDDSFSEGMVSSSSYQVNVTAFAPTEAEARSVGEKEARRKAYNLILKEPFFRLTLSEDGKQQIRRLVEEKGRIVKVEHVRENSYNVTYRITQPGGLRNYFRNVR
jgi:hypothetical protein